MSTPEIIVDKVKYDGTKVRLEFQRLRKDNRYTAGPDTDQKPQGDL